MTHILLQLPIIVQRQCVATGGRGMYLGDPATRWRLQPQVEVELRVVRQQRIGERASKTKLVGGS